MRDEGVNTLLQAEWLLLIINENEPVRNLEIDAATFGCTRQALHSTKQALEKKKMLTSCMPPDGTDLRRRVVTINPKLVAKIIQWKTDKASRRN